jgi:hypothetical protein
VLLPEPPLEFNTMIERMLPPFPLLVISPDYRSIFIAVQKQALIEPEFSP